MATKQPGSGVRVQITRNMVAEYPYIEAHPQHGSGAELRSTAVNDGAHLGRSSHLRRDQDDKRWIQNITPVPESSVLGKRDMNT